MGEQDGEVGWGNQETDGTVRERERETKPKGRLQQLRLYGPNLVLGAP